MWMSQQSGKKNDEVGERREHCWREGTEWRVKVFTLDRRTNSLSPNCRRESRMCEQILTSHDSRGA